MRICILGNSVPLLVSPYRQNEEEMTYGEILRNNLFEVKNCGRQSTMISDLYKTLEEDCLSFFPDIVVLNYGIVECTYRTRTRWLQSRFSINAWKNTIISTPLMVRWKRIRNYVIKKLLRPFDRFFHCIGLHYRWMPPSKFGFCLMDISRAILKETGVNEIIVLGMLEARTWLEREAPKTSKSIIRYNEIMKSLCSSTQGLVFIDTARLLGNDLAYSDDGIHFTATGHELIAKAIADEINKNPKRNQLSWKDLQPNKRGYREKKN